MVTPNSSFDELASITIANYSDDLRDNVSNNIPTWAMFDDEGAVVEEDGGTYLLENLDFADNVTFKWYSGYEEISTSPTEAFTSASYDWKEGGCNIVFNAREVAINSGREKKHDLVRGKTKNAERTLRNNVGAALYYAGTESDGKAFGGAQYIIADDPTTGIVGGINRATAGNEFWRNQVMDENVDSITLSATTIFDGMELLWTRCSRGMDVPTLIAFGETYWRYFAAAVDNKQMYVREDAGKSNNGTGKVSFQYWMFKSAKVFFEPNAGATRGYFYNTDYYKVKVHRDRNFTVGKAIPLAGQRATVIPVDLMANVVCGNASLQGVMHP
jgi:hypothetical protein